ncbi:MAG: protein kinase [bacterium]|nr:MAG: protein kinase [bacterium]
MIGKTILHFKIIEELGRGGMGVVYLAQDTRLRRQVAIKFLPRAVSVDAESRKRFKLEAQAAAALNHPNITQIYAIEEAENEMFIVMEHVEGMELRELMLKKPLSISNVLAYTRQIAEGLEAAHRKGVVHRDIKSSNIMVTDEGKLKIMDFGLAKVGEGLHLTKEQSTLGTAAYMSPEQARGEAVDHRTDVWSFGVVLYEMLAGELPFRGDYEQVLIYAILNEEPDWLSLESTGISVKLIAILKKMLAKQPAERFQNMKEIILNLEDHNSKNIPAAAHTPTRGEISEEKKVIPGLAVLPFSDLRNDPAMSFLGFALADQIIGTLSYLQNILVRPSSAIRKYQSQIVDAPTAGIELQVDYIITGYFLKEAEVVRLNVELVKAQSNDLVWREAIEVKYENAFKLQDIVSEKVIQGLKIQFSSDERGRMQTNIPQNPLAYEYYLRAVSYPHTNEGDKLAIEMLQKSLNLDDNYAPTHAELGYRQQSFGTFALQGSEAYKSAEASYVKALSINDQLLSALGGLANLYTDIGKTEKALEYAQRMITINPNNSLAHFSLSYLLRYAGLLEESQKAAERAFSLEPENPKFRSLGYTYFYRGIYEQAMKIFEIDKGSVMALAWRGFAYFCMGDGTKAVEYFDQVIPLEPEGHFGLHFGAIRAAHLGEKKQGLQLAKKWEDTNPYDAEVWYNIANTYSLLGDKSGCLRALRRAVDGGFFCYAYMMSDPLLTNFRADPDIQSILELAKSRNESFKKLFKKIMPEFILD